MTKPFRIRDPVHNFIELRDEEVRVLKTLLFQRLRGIRQLALANLVYPGALHTRFDHSLGVCHVAGLMAGLLDLNEEEIRLVRLAGLLHDLGHGPFSHVSENLLQRYAEKESIPSDQKLEKIHEIITCHLISNDKQLHDLLSKDRCICISQLLDKGFGQRILRSIVSGPLDADKQDYLLRDSFFCGVPYGKFDIHQFHRSLISAGPEHDKELRIAPDGVTAVEQFVLAKYYLFNSVYSHHVRLISDQMIVRSVILGIEHDQLDDLRRIYAFDNSPEFFTYYSIWDDNKFLTSFDDIARPKTLFGQLISNLKSRRLHKRVFQTELTAFKDAQVSAKLLNVGKKENDSLRGKLETEIAKIIKEQCNLDFDSRLIIVHGYNIKSVRVSSRDDEGSIPVGSDKMQSFEEVSPLFASISEKYAKGFIDVYAPIDWQTPTERQRVRNLLQNPIRECLEKICLSATEGGQ